MHAYHDLLSKYLDSFIYDKDWINKFGEINFVFKGYDMRNKINFS
jgi:hypothetical protein